MIRPTGLAAVATVVLCPAGLLAAPLPVCPVSNGQTVGYDIMRGGDLIGHQAVHYAVAGADMTVTIDVAVALHALGVRVYRYQHHGEESWHGGQMVHLVTTTDDDGTPRHVDASRDPQTGTWRGITGPQPGTAPLLSTSFWNIQTVAQTRLLDRETGKIIAVHADAPVPQTLQLGARQVAATKYDLAGPVKGSVWYDGNGCWVQAVYNTLVDGSLIEIHAH